MEFRKKLIELRKNKKWYQTDVAEKIGVARATYGAYEQGNRQPDFDTLERLADLYGVSVDYLLGRTDNPNDEQNELDYYKNKIVTEFPDINLMFKDMESLSADDMKEVYEYIKFKKSQKKGD